MSLWSLFEHGCWCAGLIKTAAPVARSGRLLHDSSRISAAR